jgi:hypothetical protein
LRECEASERKKKADAQGKSLVEENPLHLQALYTLTDPLINRKIINILGTELL